MARNRMWTAAWTTTEAGREWGRRPNRRIVGGMPGCLAPRAIARGQDARRRCPLPGGGPDARPCRSPERTVALVDVTLASHENSLFLRALGTLHGERRAPRSIPSSAGNTPLLGGHGPFSPVLVGLVAAGPRLHLSSEARVVVASDSERHPTQAAYALC